MLKSIKDITFAKKFTGLFSTVLFDCSGNSLIISTEDFLSFY